VAEATSIEVDRERAVTITFDDGRTCRFGLEELRGGCPCAQCRGWRERGEPSWPRPGGPERLTITDAGLVGAWGISFTWSDGHATGIYSWDLLAAWCAQRDGGEGA
jgi:DUF971 family protein